MSKRRNKSRLTRTDVNTICQMQQKIDAYESYILGLCGFSNLKKETNYVVIMAGTPMDDWVTMTWRNMENMKKELQELRKEKAQPQ